MRNMSFCKPWFFKSHRFSDDECIIPREPTLQGIPVFSYKELKTATSGFKASNKVGEGSFGSVYKGRLQDGSIVAVKVLELESLQGEKEFISEISMLSNITHENLITLKGCCITSTKRFLIYDYMENNSMELAFLGGSESRRKFSWKMRTNILLGIARGLAFLHEEVDPHIVHRDIKPANILLDKNFVPKIADFGLAKLFLDSVSHVSTRVTGTLGYLAPEYAISGHLTRKSDVYSFGILLLLIVSGHKAVDYNLEQKDAYLVTKVWKAYKSNNLQQLVDPSLDGDYPEEEPIEVLKVGLLCVQEISGLRPQMSEVVKMLGDGKSREDVSISKPGHLLDLMYYNIGDDHSQDNTAISKISTSFSC
ncbi:putative serine/threonine-protein kinase [Chenopodium quinoa]|uniref:non-specific serine/threonine protein kinase n=1 Tax=Chenopodium quinoa TaxID=63459 RepID=A0A803LL74_CHEQI|nr:putative serine/threonine-protein kinase [Chenopodium quinoa]